MPEQKPDHTFRNAVIAGGVALLFVGYQQTAKNEADDIGGIDVLRAEVASVKADIEEIRSGTLSRTELEGQLNTINATLIRRFGEDVSEPIERVRANAEKNEDVLVDHAERLSALEAKVGK